jgi:hypothetical protein
MTPVEIIALIVVLGVIVKLITLAVNQKSLANKVDMMASKPVVGTIIATLLAAVVLYYLLMEITIIQVFATLAFVMLMVLISFLAFPKELTKLAKEILKTKSILKTGWFVIVLWLGLIIWVIIELYPRILT